MKRSLIILVLSIAVIAYAVSSTSRERYALTMHSQVNTVGLIAHYKLWDGLMATGKVFDYSLNGHVGTLFDTDAPAAPTLIPTYPGFDFDGDNDYIEIADHDDFSFGDGSTDSPFSISAWVYMRDNSYFQIINKTALGEREWMLDTNPSGELDFLCYERTTTKYIARTADDVSPTMEWMHIVATYDGTGGDIGSGMTLFVNGVEIDSSPRGSTLGGYVAMENADEIIRIGASASAKYADGLIDNVMIWNKEFTAIEAKNIYEITRWRYDGK